VRGRDHNIDSDNEGRKNKKENGNDGITYGRRVNRGEDNRG
jgi:hypothetical protein